MKKLLVLFSLVIFAVHMLECSNYFKRKGGKLQSGKPVESVTIAAKKCALVKHNAAKQTDAKGAFSIDLPKESN
jgi:hypothetical protein